MTRGGHARHRVRTGAVRASIVAAADRFIRQVTRVIAQAWRAMAQGDTKTRVLAAGGAVVLAGGLTAAAVLGGLPFSRAATGGQVPPNEAYVAPPATGAVQVPPGGFRVGTGAPAPTHPPRAARVRGLAPIAVGAVSTPAFGPVLTADGLTLYRVSAKGGALTCGSACTPGWHALLLAAGQAVQLAPSLTGQLGTITLPGGAVQVTYNGVPLYRFTGDHAPGEATGAGGRWHVVRPR
jgi:predicted lipoprotein with Yx(FWY)xxD motif